MSHQKTKRIESPLKGLVHSMLLQNHQQTIFSSRLTQKRKPIFEDTINRSSVSRSNSARRKIFSKTQKSKQKEGTLHFSKLFQAQQISKRQGEDINQHEIQQPQLSDQSVQSSSIQEDSGLGDVKRQLFPVTPIKRIIRQTEDLQKGREWLTNSSKNCNKELFEDEHSPSKSNHSISTNNIDKTIFKFSYNTPDKRKQHAVQEMSQKTQLATEQRPSSFVRNLNVELSSKQYPTEKQPEKDIAKQIRDLHSKMLQKAKVCSNVDQQNSALKEQNQRLREENRMLKSQQLRLSIRPEDYKRNSLSQEKDELKKMANESIFVKVKVEKAKNMIKNLLSLSQAESLPANSIINLEQTLKQVLKELEL